MRTMGGGPCLHYDCSNRNSFGYCRTTVCINEHYRQEQWGSPITTNKSERVVKKPETNADRIRSMTDEELAEWMAKYCERKTVFCPNFGAHDCQESCEQCWLDWLKQEVTE